MHILGSYMLPVRFRFKAAEQLGSSRRASEVNSASIARALNVALQKVRNELQTRSCKVRLYSANERSIPLI